MYSLVKDPSIAILTPSNLPPVVGLSRWIGIACGILEDVTAHWPGVSVTLSILSSPGLEL